MAFKMKGHALPGINQRSETKNMADGRSKSSAFQKNGDKKKKEKEKEVVYKDMSTKTILEREWANYQKTLKKGHPDKGKPVPKQLP